MDLNDENHGEKRVVSLSDSDSDESSDVPIIVNTENTNHQNPIPLCSVEKQAEEEADQSVEIVDNKVGDNLGKREYRNKEIVQ